MPRGIAAASPCRDSGGRIRIIVPLSMSLLQAGARSPRRRLLLSYREKKHTLFFFFLSHTARQSARASRAFRASRDARRASSANGLGFARAFIRSFVRSIVRALTMRREYEHVLVPSEDGSARAGPATLLNDRETDATRTADRARIRRHHVECPRSVGRSVGLDESRLESSVPVLYIHACMSKRRSDCGWKDAPPCR